MHNTARYIQWHYNHGINLEKTNLITSCYQAIKYNIVSSFQKTEDFFFMHLLNYESKKHYPIKLYHPLFSVQDFSF